MHADQTWRSDYAKGRHWFAQNNFKAAIEAFESAIRLNPHAVEVYHDLGVAWHRTGHYQEALTCFKSAVDINNRMVSSWLNGGTALCCLDRLEEAAAWFQKAVQCEPTCANAHFNLANALKSLGRGREAVEHYRRALAVDPNLVEAHNNIGTLFLGLGRLEEALACFEDAIRVNPAYVRSLYNAGLTSKRLGRIGKAIEYAHQCRNLQPEHGESLALLVSAYQQACRWGDLERADVELAQLTQWQLKNGQRPSESPFMSFTRSMDNARNLSIARSWSQWTRQRQGMQRTKFDFASHDRSARRLTIGYLSEHFRNAATGHLIAGLFKRHDRRRFKIFAYSWGADDGSYYRREIQNGVDRFVNIADATDAEAAGRIYSDKVDILVDLMGWMQGHRMGIPAQRPAPVQVHYLGYPGTTGADYIDYLIADKIVIPPEQLKYYAEKIIWMPNCYQVTDPDTPVEDRPRDRADFGLPLNSFVFCSFNTDYKIDRRTFDTWTRILQAVPDSVLWLLVRCREAEMNLRQAAAKQGIHPDRLVFASPLPKSEHLARLKLADLALDTLTVNGHTTTSDALWAGVPVITCQGSHFASRVAGSILRAAGMDELVTRDMSGYEKLSVDLAADPTRLRQIRQKMEDNRVAYPLFQIDDFTRSLETAYLHMWDMYCQ